MSLRQFHIQNKAASGGLILGPNEYPVFLQSGQSNGVGDTNVPPDSYAGAQSGVRIWTNAPAASPNVFEFKTYEAGVNSGPRFYPDGITPFPAGFGWSVEAVVGKELQARFNKDVYIIKSAQGGQPISTWDNGSFMWIELSTYITNAVAAIDALGRTPVFVGMAWVQGEAEVVAGNSAATYTTKLADLITRVRALDARMANMPFYTYQLSVTYQTNVNPPGPSFTPTRAQINTAMQDAVALRSRAYAINTDGLANIGTVDGTHYNKNALLSMGNELYNRIINQP